MKISAGLIIRNEADRYLRFALENLATFVDIVCIYDDGSSDDWEDLIPRGLLTKVAAVSARERDAQPSFHRHAIGRNKLLELTLGTAPDWIVASDADELFTDGLALRRACETTRADVLSVEISEAWELCDDRICTREDGGWRSHPIGAVWRASKLGGRALSLADKDTATGRVPDAIHRVASTSSGVGLVHLGWANETERAARYKRHVGSAHSSQHVESIMWTDSRVKLAARDWPSAWPEDLRSSLLERANR